ncbi:hypothetical protein AXG93_2175s1050 [Marchantia polymorpha subsp. ruderalis]|uniref:Uncharacterized protein n=1 Tax=Marchantia polymorpha subsp. ruderalis TaxID=1480154 RepID=A0A176W7S8_MARPO|nr:hypothetical protein AXG93_2175s1050 [Marchantia polymorpha subsp. ruderalis]
MWVGLDVGINESSAMHRLLISSLPTGDQKSVYGPRSFKKLALSVTIVVLTGLSCQHADTTSLPLEVFSDAKDGSMMLRPLYTLKYTLDTSRSNKCVLTTVIVSTYNLYILSIVYVDGAKSPVLVDVDDALHKVLNYFELLA